MEMAGRVSESSINLKHNGHSDAAVDLTGKVHQLPCCIKYDGPAPVSHYFKPKSTGMSIDGLSVEEAHFRGRKLLGTTVPIPEGYSGFIIADMSSRKENDVSDNTPNCWETKAKFQNIMVWNHDGLPSENDNFLRAFHLFSVADALHQAVSAEDLETASFDLN